MPNQVTQHYYFGGWATVTLYSEEEMASAMRLSIEELRSWLKKGIGLCTHGRNYKGESEFNPPAYDTNLRVWACHLTGGHEYRVDRTYTDVQLKKCVCKKCERSVYPRRDGSDWSTWSVGARTKGFPK